MKIELQFERLYLDGNLFLTYTKIKEQKDCKNVDKDNVYH